MEDRWILIQNAQYYEGSSIYDVHTEGGVRPMWTHVDGGLGGLANVDVHTEKNRHHAFFPVQKSAFSISQIFCSCGICEVDICQLPRQFVMNLIDSNTRTANFDFAQLYS